MGLHIIQFPRSGRVFFTSALTCLPDRRGSDKRRSTYSPIRPTADRPAERIGQALRQAILSCLMEPPRKLAVVLHWITASLPGLNSQNDKGRKVSNPKPFVVHLDTSSFSFDYAPPLPVDIACHCHGSNPDSEGFVTCEKNVPARREK